MKTGEQEHAADGAPLGAAADAGALERGRKRRYGIRMNDQFRICFAWRLGDAFDVEVVDFR